MYTMATSDIKYETLISSRFPDLDRLRLKVHEVIREPDDCVEHTHDGPWLRIIHDGAKTTPARQDEPGPEEGRLLREWLHPPYGQGDGSSGLSCALHGALTRE